MKRGRENSFLCAAEVTEGLEFVTEAELIERGAAIINLRPGEIIFHFPGSLAALLEVKTAQSISLVQRFVIPRPRGLLGNEQFRALLQQIETVRRLSPRDAFSTFFIAAAGSDSSVMQRLKSEISSQTGLAPSDDKGDLWLRIRPGRVGEWETLVRLTLRPLVTRAWRVCNLEGALNAATAHAMIRLTRPQPRDVFVNLGSGSGTLLIERLAHSRCRSALGIEQNAEHLRCALANIRASGTAACIRFAQGDMTTLPLQDGSASALCADLPFGQLSGSHEANRRLYPRVLEEAARVAEDGARFVVITHEVHLMEAALARAAYWSLEQAIRVNLRGLHPRIYVLQRRSRLTC